MPTSDARITSKSHIYMYNFNCLGLHEAGCPLMHKDGGREEGRKLTLRTTYAYNSFIELL
jgi:hypothetical protein